MAATFFRPKRKSSLRIDKIVVHDASDPDAQQDLPQGPGTTSELVFVEPMNEGEDVASHDILEPIDEAAETEARADAEPVLQKDPPSPRQHDRDLLLVLYTLGVLVVFGSLAWTAYNNNLAGTPGLLVVTGAVLAAILVTYDRWRRR
ncbi:hypothetical protein AB0F44_25715 [Nocardioides sp. NPDC023903]|uniref:hypothetical protein n=1 Tax=Nocardioides sp. NPDC023903 TaxID=3157195 RepID=UPI0033ED43F4